jgi:hypothetical protein
VCLLESKPQLQNEQILFDFNENPDNDVNRPANPDFLVKYNLQNYVDANEKEVNKDIPSTQQTNKETYKDIPTTQQTNKVTSAIETVVDQRNVRNAVHETIEPDMSPKPLQSSLRSGKKPSGRNVKFADDVIKQEIFIDRHQTENILLQKSPNLTSVVTRTCPNQTNTIILESLQADVNLMDPNWYSHIPCECCDNENITGRD